MSALSSGPKQQDQAVEKPQDGYTHLTVEAAKTAIPEFGVPYLIGPWPNAKGDIYVAAQLFGDPKQFQYCVWHRTSEEDQVLTPVPESTFYGGDNTSFSVDFIGSQAGEIASGPANPMSLA
ncbi:hypothetical protein HOD30_02365 [Candidatus Peregrinibacteria bacterium]|nr:hypothetical protein [Candidatus Peregrinibacteria bacterium]MBT4631845.1 hypothetical protein [Candidatus Peregrinibacteria bacterium]MBT5516522.1 hypothetical protein [Candidatus Peregrinibacteria bacterium]MBT5823625.1 hypothetical protein [Candidatus Peregrinibacteria bacterium]